MKFDAIVIACLCLFIVFSLIFRVNYSSITIFCSLAEIGCTPSWSLPLLNYPRTIRSDEWLVSTPLQMGQIISGNNTYSSLIGDTVSLPFLTASVDKTFFSVFKPLMLPSLLMDMEHGLVLSQALSVASFILSAMILTRMFGSPRKQSVLLSISLFCVPFLQWWNAHNIVTAFFAALAFFLWMLKQKRLSWLKYIFIVLALTYLILVNVHFMYPPFQLPLFLLAIAVIFGQTVNTFSHRRDLKWLVPIGVIAVASILLASLSFAFYIHYHSPEYRALQNTVYPSGRSSIGGTLEKFRLFSGWYDVQLVKAQRSISNINQTEFSGFPLFIYILIPILVFWQYRRFIRKEKLNLLTIAICSYSILILIWMVFGLPGWLARVSGLLFVPANRAYLGLGLANYLLVLQYFFSSNPSERVGNKIALLLAVAFSLILVLEHQVLISIDAQLYSSIQLLAFVVMTAFWLVYTLLTRRSLLFSWALMIFCVMSTLRIYPVNFGLTQLQRSGFSRQMSVLESRQPGKVAIYGNRYLSSVINASGFSTLTGVYLYPQANVWTKFDHEGEYKDVWNRYAHVYFVIPEESKRQEVAFNLVAEDSFTVTIDPCNQILNDFNVRYVVSTDALKSSCLTEVPKNGFQHGIYIYERR